MLEKKVARSAKATPKKAGIAREMTAPTMTKSVTRTVAAIPAASRGRQEDLHERVRRRAYELWESEGRPAGREHDHWFQAEREVVTTRRQHAA
jgi:Protein of unknown function (DUF2934)